MKIDRAIIGGGFSGLLGAYEALERGETVVVVEATNTTGGVIQPVRVGGITVDAGAEAFSTVDDHVIALAHRIGLGDDIVAPSGLPARIIGPSSTTAIPEGIFGIPRNLDDPVVSSAVGKDAVATARTKDREPLPVNWQSLSVGEMVRTRLGEKFLSHLTEPVISGVHGVGADQLDADVIFPKVVREAMACGSLVEAVNRVRGSHPSPGLAVATISGGLFRLTERLAETVLSLGGQMMTGTRVTGLSSQATGWAIDTDSTPIEARRVTLACGLSAQKELLRTAFRRPVLPPGQQTDSHVVIAHVQSQELSAFPLGSGALVSSSRDDTIRATTHLTAKWHYLRDALPPDTHLVRFSTSAPSPTSSSLTDIVSSGLSSLYGVSDAVVTDSVRVSWPGSLLTPHRGHHQWVADNLPLWASQGLDVRGPLVSGNGLLGITQSHQKRNAA